ncbi:YdaE family protein [Enterobacter soli]|uniref:YdaE family protein n=1 Tax=Enterobacter soli TaxID=885040 RepID=UPI003ED88835
MQKKCGYCGKPIEGEPVKNELLFRQGNRLARKEKEYCSERCASYDQMAHES